MNAKIFVNCCIQKHFSPANTNTSFLIAHQGLYYTYSLIVLINTLTRTARHAKILFNRDEIKMFSCTLTA